MLQSPINRLLGGLLASLLASAQLWAQSAPSMPTTQGERLSGGTVQLATAVQGQPTVLVASFSRESSASTTDWLRTLHTDPAFQRLTVWQVVELEDAPRLIRPLIRNALRKQTPAAWQANTVVFTADTALWRGWFAVGNEREPCVVLLDGNGKPLWHGNGGVTALAASLKATLR